MTCNGPSNRPCNGPYIGQYNGLCNDRQNGLHNGLRNDLRTGLRTELCTGLRKKATTYEMAFHTNILNSLRSGHSKQLRKATVGPNHKFNLLTEPRFPDDAVA